MAESLTASVKADKEKKIKGKVPRNYVIFLLTTIFLASLLTIINHYEIISINKSVLMVFRWIVIGAFVGYALYKKSLTTWILISMMVGAEFGYDLPHVAVKMQLISKIFLRLIKTIIAPLLFATLVVGIAGHSNLKQVGTDGMEIPFIFRGCINDCTVHRIVCNKYQQGRCRSSCTGCRESVGNSASGYSVRK